MTENTPDIISPTLNAPETSPVNILNIDLNTKSNKLGSLSSIFKNPLFISLIIILIFGGLIALIVIKTQVPRLPQAGPKEKAWGQLTNPKVTVVSYEDLECSACKAYNPTSEQLITDYKGKSVKFVFRDYPLVAVHPNPQIAAEASEYANDNGKFTEYKDKLFDNQVSTAVSVDTFVKYGVDLGLNGDEMRTKILGHAYETRVNDEKALGDKTGKVTGTPAVFINDEYVQTVGNVVPVATDISVLIDKALSN